MYFRNSAIADAFNVLEEKMTRERNRQLEWAPFMGNIVVQERENNDPILQPSGKFIDVSSRKGIGDRTMFPMVMNLTGAGRFGDAILLGTEEDPMRRYGMVHYNQIRHAVPIRKGRKEEADLDFLAAADLNHLMLAQWHAEIENWNVSHAVYCGVSENLSCGLNHPVFGNGLALDIRHHPNLYVYSKNGTAAGVITRVGTAGKFPTAAQVYTAVSSTSNPAPFTCEAVRKIRMLLIKKLKPLFTKGGQKFYGCKISPEQMETLMADPEYKNVVNSQQFANIQSHPLVANAVGYYGQVVFFESIVSVRGYCGTSGSDLNVIGTRPLVASDIGKSNPRFEPVEGAIAIGGAENRAAIFFGAGGMRKSDFDKLGFETDKFDYSNWKGLGAAQMYGYGRSDMTIELDGLALEKNSADCTDIYNVSTLLLVTWQ